jgi:hypothetical protein
LTGQLGSSKRRSEGKIFIEINLLSSDQSYRLASQVFCQDVAGCIYLGKPPSLLPRSVNVVLPCYESAWEAGTAAECLQRLQSHPGQLSISTALRMLQEEDAQNVPLLEVSGYGMFVLIHGELDHLKSFVHRR